MNNIPKSIILSTQKSIYVILFICVLFISFSIALLVKNHTKIEDIVLGSLNCSLPLLLICFCYILWKNHEFYTSGKISEELNSLSKLHKQMEISYSKLNRELTEIINCSKNKEKDKLIESIIKIQTINKNELQQMQQN